MSRKIERLGVVGTYSPVMGSLHDKVNEVIDAVNEMREPTVMADPHAPHTCEGMCSDVRIAQSAATGRWWIEEYKGAGIWQSVNSALRCPCCDWVAP